MMWTTTAARYLALLFLPVSPDQGILVMAHGGDEAWNRDVEAVVAPLKDRYPVEIAFGMARTSTLREAVERLEQKGVRRIAVVRMFISGESFLPETEYILGLRTEPPAAPASAAAPHGAVPAAPPSAHGDHGDHCAEAPQPIASKCTFVLSQQGVADSALVDEILLERANALSKTPSRESVLLLAHGPADDAENERWLAKMEKRARGISQAGGFREVRCETLREDWPEKRAVSEKRIREFVQQHSRNGGRVIVIPFRVAGFGPYKEVLEGLEYVSDGRGFCPHPNMTTWIEQAAHRCFADR
jgi:hypothetical protein